MKLTIYPYDFEYKVQEDTSGELHTYIYLYSITTEGKKVCVVHEHVPFFYATTKGVATQKFEEKLRSLEVTIKGKKAKVLNFKKVTKFFPIYSGSINNHDLPVKSLRRALSHCQTLTVFG